MKRSGEETVFDLEDHGYDAETGEYRDELTRYLDENEGQVHLTITSDKDPQSLLVTCWDGAGNVSTSEGENPQTEGELLLNNVLITTNVASRVFYNRPLFALLLGGGITLAVIAAVLVFRKVKEGR